MTKAEVLAKIIIRQGNVPSQLEATIEGYMEDTIDYLLGAGINDNTTFIDIDNDDINPECIGVINRGVADLWNYGGEGGTLSEYFYQRADQLRHKKVVANG